MQKRVLKSNWGWTTRSLHILCDQMRTVLSWPPLANWPPGTSDNLATAFVWPVRFWSGWPVSTSPIRTVKSADALASRPPGSTSRSLAAAVCPSTTSFVWPDCKSQILIAASSEPLTRSPLGSNARLLTLYMFVWPVRINLVWPVGTFHMRISW